MSPATDQDFKAQFGEDRLLAKHFDNKSQGYYIEIGVYDGVQCSNSYYFEKLGWHGLLIEADPNLLDQCRQNRPNARLINCAVVAPNMPQKVSFEIVLGWRALSSLSVRRHRRGEYVGDNFETTTITVPARTLDDILAELSPSQIDFITIDVEGDEWGVLEGFSIRQWHPEIVITERNMYLPDPRIVNYFHKNGYLYLRTTGGINDWFYLSNSGKPNLCYHLWLFIVYWLPSYALQFVVSPLKKTIKSLLTKIGLWESIRSLAGRK